MNENYSLSDIAAVTGGGYGGGNGLFANDNWMWLFILFLFGSAVPLCIRMFACWASLHCPRF